LAAKVVSAELVVLNIELDTEKVVVVVVGWVEALRNPTYVVIKPYF
jgi:hypothetical protein